MCSASRKHSIMKNPNCSILKRMDTASSCLQGRSLTRWKRESTLLAIKCRLAEMVHPMNGLNNCKTVSTATLHCKTKCLLFSGHQLEVFAEKEERTKCIKGEGKKRRWRKWGFTWGGIWKPHKSSQFFAHVLTLIKVLQTTVSHCVCQTAIYNKTRKSTAFGRVIPSIREFYLHANMNTRLSRLLIIIAESNAFKAHSIATVTGLYLETRPGNFSDFRKLFRFSENFQIFGKIQDFWKN